MIDWNKRFHIPFIFVAFICLILAVFLEANAVWTGWRTHVAASNGIFVGMAILNAVFAISYLFFRQYLYSERWVWFHFALIVVALLVVLISRYNHAQLVRLAYSPAREAFDDLVYLRVQNWTSRAYVTLAIGQLIFPANLLLGWLKYRSEN